MKRHSQAEARSTTVPTTAEFMEFAGILHKTAGIYLADTEKNRVLIASRLQKMLRAGSVSSYRDLLNHLKSGAGDALSDFVNAMTTNTTSFFREPQHFSILTGFLKSITRDTVSNPVRIWCTPCSSGEEAYTIAMVCLEAGLDPTQVRILATDIDASVLDKARKATYPGAKKAEIAPHIFKNYCVPSATQNTFSMTPAMVKMIKFGRFNLLLDYPFEHRFDVIFCRNVLIYFDRSDSERVVMNLRDNLTSDGMLFLGHSETSAGSVPGLSRTGPAVFQKSRTRAK